MGSRSKKIMALINENGAEKENLYNIENIQPDKDDELEKEVSKSQRVLVRSSSISSSSSSPSSSTSFYEDTDDSVKDPNYSITPQRNIQIDSSSDEEEYFPSEEPTNAVPKKISEFSSVIPTVSITSDNNNDKLDIPTSTTPEIIHPTTIVRCSTNITIEPTPTNTLTPTKRGRKRQRNEEGWKRNITKRLRNNGKEYQSSKTRRTISERRLKEPCKDSCKYKCGTTFTESQRLQLNEDYWKLGTIQTQWSFIANSVEDVVPKHRYVRMDADGNCSGPKRKNNQAFYFTVSGTKIRVCKFFFQNTLGINSRPIDTAMKKKNKSTNITVMKDNRGCHGKQPKVDENIKKAIKEFIESIPKIESHYIRSHSKRHYIDGSKTVADLHKDYVEICKKNNAPYGNYIMFYRIFTHDFNISFFIPKKDLCETCEAFKNCNDEERETLKESYNIHQKEKELSRVEKEKDKANKNVKLAVYDLQAVHQCPKGDVSVFYYSCKLNVLNFSIYDLHTNIVECYVWDESNAKRGVNEIATCIYRYLEAMNNTGTDIDIIFYSDNCAGQQKNKFMISMYLCALQKLPNIRSITHKYLIKGHTQNEGDSAHSQIEKQVKRQLRSGPMYTPDAFIGAIKAARKKSEPFRVKELCYDDIYNWKNVCTQMGVQLQKDHENKLAKIGEMKIIKLLKNEPRAIYFKRSYSEEEYKKAIVIKRRREIDIVVYKAYEAKPGISERKKADLMELVGKNLIPKYYRPFFEAL